MPRRPEVTSVSSTDSNTQTQSEASSESKEQQKKQRKEVVLPGCVLTYDPETGVLAQVYSGDTTLDLELAIASCRHTLELLTAAAANDQPTNAIIVQLAGDRGKIDRMGMGITTLFSILRTQKEEGSNVHIIQAVLDFVYKHKMLAIAIDWPTLEGTGFNMLAKMRGAINVATANSMEEALQKAAAYVKK